MNVTLDVPDRDEFRAIVREEVRAALADLAREPEPWLSVKSAAVYLDTSEDAVRALIRRGQLPSFRSETGSIRLLREDLDSHARGQSNV